MAGRERELRGEGGRGKLCEVKSSSERKKKKVWDSCDLPMRCAVSFCLMRDSGREWEETGLKGPRLGV